MTAATRTLRTPPSTAADAPRPVRTVLTLAAVEGRRLVRSPLYLAGVALSVFFFVGATMLIGDIEDIPYVVWTGIGLYPVAAGTLLASFVAALRSRRHGTNELYGTAPTSVRARTAAHLVAVGWAVAGSIAVLAASAAYHRLWEGVTVHFSTGVRPAVPGLLELAQGPAIVLLFGAFAVMLARWLPTLLAVPFAAVALLFHFVTGSWGIGGTARWFLPLVTHERAVGWVQVTPTSGYPVVEGFHTVPLAWHVVYLLGLAQALAVIALLRHGADRRLLALGIAAAVVIAGAGLLQIP